MEKAYDVKALLLKCQEKGGPGAELVAKANFEALIEWLEESAVLSENKIDDVAVPLATATIKPLVMKALDQIDGVQ
jgi:hypothetical protein